MSNILNSWAAALEDAAPVAEIDIDINEAPEIETDEDGAPLEAVDAYGEPTYEALETEMIEDEAEYDEAEETVEKLEETVVQLESAAVAVENRINSNGGMTSGELEFMMIGLEGRIKNTSKLFPSTESFSNSRMNASTEAMKSLKEGLEALWNALSNAIDAVIRKLREWFGTTKRAATKLKTRAIAIRKAGKDLEGKTAKEKEITLNRVHSFLVGNKFAKTGAEAEKQMEVLAKSVKANLELRATKAWSEYVNKYAEVVDGLIKNAASNPKSEEAMIAEVTSIPGYNHGGYLYTEGMTEAGNRFGDVKARMRPPLPGGMSVFLQYVDSSNLPKTADEIDKAKGKRGLVLATTTKESPKKEGGNTKFAVLTPMQIQDIAAMAQDMCESIIAFDAAWVSRDKGVAATQAKVKAAMKSVKKDAKGADENSAKTAKVLGALLRSLSHDIKAAPGRDAKLIQYSLTTGSDFLGYCTRSISAYKEGKVPADKESKDEKPKTPPATGA